MKKILLLLGFLLLIIPLFSAKHKLKFHHFLPLKAGIPAGFIQPWIDKIKKESRDELHIQQFPSMQLGGKPASLVNQVKDGTVDLIWTLMGYTPGRFPKSEAFELPFMVTTAEATSKAFYEFYERNLKKEFKDYKIITVHTHGPGIIHSRFPIRNLKDISGKKLRGPTRIITKLLESLGAVPIGMPVPKVAESLSKGVIDGTLIPWEVTLPVKSSEIVKNHTSVYGKNGLYTATFMVAMNRNTYKRLPGHLKKVIDANSGLKTAAWAGRVMDAEDRVGMDKAIKLRNTLIALSKTETEKWKEKSKKVINDWIKEMNQKGYDGEKLVQDARLLISKYSKQ